MLLLKIMFQAPLPFLLPPQKFHPSTFLGLITTIDIDLVILQIQLIFYYLVPIFFIECLSR